MLSTAKVVRQSARAAVGVVLLASVVDSRKVHCQAEAIENPDFSEIHKYTPQSTYRTQRTYTRGRNFVADAVQIALPSVVRIQVATFGFEGSGSGFVVDSKLFSSQKNNLGSFIVTNAHVLLTPSEMEKGVSLVKKVVTVEVAGERHMAEILVEDSRMDLALLHVPTKQFQPLALASRTRHAEFVAALGAPLEMENSVTVGIVSNPNRSVGNGQRYVQTDAHVEKGSSGGPLVNLNGEVIAMISLKLSEGVAYGIPAVDVISTLQRALRLTEHENDNGARRRGVGIVDLISPNTAPTPLSSQRETEAVPEQT